MSDPIEELKPLASVFAMAEALLLNLERLASDDSVSASELPRIIALAHDALQHARDTAMRVREWAVRYPETPVPQDLGPVVRRARADPAMRIARQLRKRDWLDDEQLAKFKAGYAEHYVYPAEPIFQGDGDEAPLDLEAMLVRRNRVSSLVAAYTMPRYVRTRFRLVQDAFEFGQYAAAVVLCRALAEAVTGAWHPKGVSSLSPSEAAAPKTHRRARTMWVLANRILHMKRPREADLPDVDEETAWDAVEATAAYVEEVCDRLIRHGRAVTRKT